MHVSNIPWTCHEYAISKRTRVTRTLHACRKRAAWRDDVEDGDEDDDDDDDEEDNGQFFGS